MLRYQAGDAAAFEPLYRRHRDGVYRHLLHGCGRPAIAGELFHDVWLNVIRTRADWQPRARFATWLYRIAHHRLIDWWRATPPGLEPLPEPGDDDEATPVPAALWLPRREQPDEQLLSAERGQRLRAALARLPIEQRDAFLLHEEGGLSLAEIAEVAGVGRETIKSRLRYALARLREALADDRT